MPSSPCAASATSRCSRASPRPAGAHSGHHARRGRSGSAAAALRFLETLERGRRLCCRRRIAVGRRPPHRIGGIAQLLRRLREVGSVLLTRQLLQPPRRLFDLFRQRTLVAVRAAALLAGQRTLPLPLGFLLLAPGQLAELLHQLVHLLIGVLLLGALCRLALVGDLVQLHLEQIGELLRRHSARHHRRPRRRAAC